MPAVSRSYVSKPGPPARSEEIDSGLTYMQSFRRKWSRFDEEKAWQSYCHALMASNEFIYVY